MAFPINHFVRHQSTPSAPGVIDLSGSGLGSFPIEALIRDPQLLAPGRYGRGPYGLDALRGAVGDLYGVPFEEVLLTAGATQANFAAVSALTQPGDRVALEHPLFESLRRGVQALGCEVASYPRPPERGYLPDLDALEALLRSGVRLVILTDPMNPTGLPLEAGMLAELEALCARFGATLVVDEIYGDFERLDAPRSHRRSGGCIVATGSLSKVYGLGHLRIGWLLAPPAVLDRAWEVVETTSGGPSVPSQALGLLALEERSEIVTWVRGRLEPNHAALARFREVCPAVRWGAPTQGSICFPRLPEGVEGAAFVAELLKAEGVRVAPGAFFGVPDAFRLSLGAPLDDLRRGLSRIGRQLARMG